jgi:hypothetical protein
MVHQNHEDEKNSPEFLNDFERAVFFLSGKILPNFTQQGSQTGNTRTTIFIIR